MTNRLAALRTRVAALLMMAGALACGGAGCGPGGGGGNDNPPQLWLALGTDELHAKLTDKQPPHY